MTNEFINIINEMEDIETVLKTTTDTALELRLEELRGRLLEIEGLLEERYC